MFLFKVPSVTWELIPKDANIIDVREMHEYRINHIKGVRNVPLSKIDTYADVSEVYVMCQSGARSARAVRFLKKKGINAINIKGGIQSYGK